MATQSTKQKGGLGERLSKLKAGADQHFDNKTSFTVEGTDYNQGSLDTELGAIIQPYTDLDTARASVKVAQAAVQAAEAKSKQFADAMTAGVQAYFGKKNPIVEDFGISLPKVPVPMTSEQKVARATKAAHTRALRGTMGPKQRRPSSRRPPSR